MGRWRSSLVIRGLRHTIRSGLAAAQGGGDLSLGRSHDFKGTHDLTTTQEPTHVQVYEGTHPRPDRALGRPRVRYSRCTEEPVEIVVHPSALLWAEARAPSTHQVPPITFVVAAIEQHMPELMCQGLFA